MAEFSDLRFADPVKVTASEGADGFTLEVTPGDFLRFVTKFNLKVITTQPSASFEHYQAYDETKKNIIMTRVKKSPRERG